MKPIYKMSFILMTIVAAFGFTSCNAALKNVKTETYKVWGNCEMCKERIENAAYKKGIAKANWDDQTKVATISFDSTQTNADEILKRIAYVGYDSEKYYAPDDVYAQLPGCCQYDRRKGESNTSNNTTNTNADTTATNTTVIVTDPLKDVYAAYFGVKDALTKDDGNTAQSKGKEFVAALNAVKMDQMETDAHTTFMKYLDNLKSDGGKIGGTNDVEKQRGYFASLSKNMYEVMKVIKPETTVYYDFCPMYNNGKGAYWISRESVIKNPFYGSQMLTCGSTKETIK